MKTPTRPTCRFPWTLKNRQFHGTPTSHSCSFRERRIWIASATSPDRRLLVQVTGRAFYKDLRTGHDNVLYRNLSNVAHHVPEEYFGITYTGAKSTGLAVIGPS